MTDQVPEEGARLAEVAYRTWQRERGVPGDAHWEAMPPVAQGAWRATAMAVLEAAAPAVRADERECILQRLLRCQECRIPHIRDQIYGHVWKPAYLNASDSNGNIAFLIREGQ